MNPKMKSAIEKITLNDATFSNEVIEPTYVNFFYGKNGAGKSTIARTFKANDEHLQWQAGRASVDYDVLVYDTDFINANLRNYGNLAGVFTVNETNIAIQEQVDTLNAERKKMGEEYNGHKTAIDQKVADKSTALSTFQSDCWSKSAEARTLFDEAIKGKKKAALFAQEILAITPVAHNFDELKVLYSTVFSGDAQQYNMLSKAGKVTYASLPGYELMGKPISSSSDTDFAKFIKALKATDWVRSGHTHFAGQTDGKCPYCQQKLPSNFDKEIAACFDAQYQDDIAAINSFQRTYELEMDSVVATLESNVSVAMPGLDLSEYEVKVQLLVDAITINKQRIAAKIKEPTTVASLEDTDSLLIEIGTLIDGFNKKIKENNEIVSDLKTKKVLCKKQVWEYLAELLKADVAAYNKALTDLDAEINLLKSKMEQLRKDATAKKKEANELNKQIVNTEATIDSINVLLDNSGFEGFHLRAKDGVANTYEVIRPDGSVAEKLSEGERNFIAFLYYYHLVKGSLSSEAVKDKIVVIDDPVSSMDSGALFIVSALVREMIEVCYNNTDYRSHKVDGDYIKQIFILTHNVYFHKEITHHQAKRYHSVSFYMIRKVENISSVKLCVRQSQRVPTEQENYNPIQNSYAALWDEYKELKTANTVKNVIRHILEYYFIQICGYEGNDLHKIVLEQNKPLFVDEVEGQKPNYDRYNIASSMLTYMNDSPAVISDGFNYIDDGSDVEQCKKVFELIFTAMHQEQHYKMMVNILLAEGCDDIFDDGKVITVLDQACGTGGMLSTSYNFIKRYNPTADVRLFGQEINPESYAICLAEMLIKGQNAENICYQDTMKKDCFPETKMRFVIENPPFGTPWGGKDAAEGVEDAVRTEHQKGFDGRWGAGLPGSGDMQKHILVWATA